VTKYFSASKLKFSKIQRKKACQITIPNLSKQFENLLYKSEDDGKSDCDSEQYAKVPLRNKAKKEIVNFRQFDFTSLIKSFKDQLEAKNVMSTNNTEKDVHFICKPSKIQKFSASLSSSPKGC
jgi:hypothetical protein